METILAILSGLSQLSHNFSGKLTSRPKFEWMNWLYCFFVFVAVVMVVIIAILNPEYFLK